MHIMCAHAGSVEADAAAALARFAPGAEYVDTSADDLAYGRAIAERWNRGGDLVIIEHDNVITAGVITSFAACGQLWCTFAYAIFAPPWTRMCDTGLGCTRFSAAFQDRFDFQALVMEDRCSNCGNVHAIWGSLDFRISVLVTATMPDVQVHVHGEVPHLHPYQALSPEDAASGGAPVLVKGGFRRLEPGEQPKPPRHPCPDWLDGRTPEVGSAPDLTAG